MQQDLGTITINKASKLMLKQEKNKG